MIPRRALAPLRRTAFVHFTPPPPSRRIAPTPILRHAHAHAPSPLRALSTTSRALFNSSGSGPRSTDAATATTTLPPTPPSSFVDASSQTPTTPSTTQTEGAPQAVDWSNSYHGVAARPFPREVADILMRPLDAADVEVKPDGILYLPEIKYRRILNEAFGPGGWGLVPRSEPVVGDKVVTREYVLVADGRFISQAQGENNFFGVEQLPSAVEGCKSNALMRCCKDIGVASELWDPVYIRDYRQRHVEMVWVENVVTKKKRQISVKKGVSVEYPFKKT